jgi:hypothetical protein
MFRLDIWLYRYASTSRAPEVLPPPGGDGVMYLKQFSEVL